MASNRRYPSIITRMLAAAAALCAGVSLVEVRAEEAPLATGRAIYEDGITSDGTPLRAERAGGVELSGKAAACVACHRRSGFGLAEGSVVVPPVTGPALYLNTRPLALKRRHGQEKKYVDYAFNRRPAYTDGTLARALRTGINSGGEELAYLMPRYRLGDADMSALVAYLRQLSAEPSPGVKDGVVHVATVVAPGHDPMREKAMVEVIAACLDGGLSASRHRFDVWRMEGEASTWGEQLRRHAASRPAFALLSGLGGSDWRPVHEFCEKEHVPCLFPNVDVPGSDREDHYNFYFSGGVALEAKVSARFITETSARHEIRRVIQLYVANGVGAAAAATLRRASIAGFAVEDRVLAPADASGIAAALADVAVTDAVVLWLDRRRLALMETISPPDAALVLASAWMGAADRGAVPVAWRARVRLVYPFDAPVSRDTRMMFNLRPWLSDSRIENVDERLQGDTLAACNLFTEVFAKLRGFHNRDRLVELMETYPSGMGNAPAAQSYPRFSLGPGQRFSSKGAYIARFVAGTGDEPKLELERDWLIP